MSKFIVFKDGSQKIPAFFFENSSAINDPLIIAGLDYFTIESIYCEVIQNDRRLDEQCYLIFLKLLSKWNKSFYKKNTFPFSIDELKYITKIKDEKTLRYKIKLLSLTGYLTYIAGRNSDVPMQIILEKPTFKHIYSIISYTIKGKYYESDGRIVTELKSPYKKVEINRTESGNQLSAQCNSTLYTGVFHLYYILLYYKKFLIRENEKNSNFSMQSEEKKLKEKKIKEFLFFFSSENEIPIDFNGFSPLR